MRLDTGKKSNKELLETDFRKRRQTSNRRGRDKYESETTPTKLKRKILSKKVKGRTAWKKTKQL